MQTNSNEGRKPEKSSTGEINSDLLGIEAYHPDLENLQRAALRFISNVIRCDPSTLVIAGETGTAKTHCLKRIARIISASRMLPMERGLMRRPLTISAFEWSDIAMEDRRDGDLAFLEAMESDVLVLDDIGAELDRFKSDEPKIRLRKLLNAREDKHNAITTNIRPEHWAKVWDNRIDDRLMRGNAVVVETFNVPRFTRHES